MTDPITAALAAATTSALTSAGITWIKDKYHTITVTIGHGETRPQAYEWRLDIEVVPPRNGFSGQWLVSTYATPLNESVDEDLLDELNDNGAAHHSFGTLAQAVAKVHELAGR